MAGRTNDALLPLCAGLLLGSAPARNAVPDVRGRTPSGFAAGRERDPDRMCFRDLQRLPAIGPARAREIVEARHACGLRGGPSAWVALAGIGDATVRSVSEALEAASRDERGERIAPERTLRADSNP